MGIVEGRLVVIIDIAVHQFDHTLQGFFAIRQQMFLHHTDIVEGINLVTLENPTERFLLTTEFSQRNSFQGTGLMVVTVADKGTLEFVEGILPTFLVHTDTGSLIIAGIGPGLVPR